jgi:hypothetical protein
MNLTKDQALERMLNMLRENREVMEFAFKKNKLDLYRASEFDHAAIYEAVEALKESIARSNGQGVPPRSPA